MKTFKPKCNCKEKYLGAELHLPLTAQLLFPAANAEQAAGTPRVGAAVPRFGAEQLRPPSSAAGLKTDGHQLILEVVTGWNAVDLEVNREIVFHCNIHDLDFEGDGKLDPLCEEARKAVLNA
ncbi:PREDICTED: UPF0728 protein C10orf53 homolog [Pseudopodoces humilis]|uniref:UPF0728 protein C10orf53 homolog n=1 Tax=Pseudopodoces humilis TaxID=181119 RepID=UPI0006B6C141|nr:PREDICTED: UPF0728 protein C10orf53 homolog [Pseudopodoces humilis]